MILQTVIDYLTDAVGLPFYGEVPPDPPEEFGVVEQTGSDSENRLYYPTLAVQSYAASLLRAASINELVMSAMDNLPTMDSVFRCRLNSDYNFTDTASKRYRWQAVFDITC